MTKTELYSSLHRDISNSITKLREAGESLGSLGTQLNEKEMDLFQKIEAVKGDLILKRASIGELSDLPPMEEAEALAAVKKFAMGVRAEYDAQIDLFNSDFEDNPITALTDEQRIRAIVRLHFFIDLFEKVGLFSEDLKWVDVMYRLESSVTWMVKQVCSSPQQTNPNNLLEIISWRWYRESVMELTYLFGLADRRPNYVLDLYQMVLEMTIRVDKSKAA